VVDKGREPVDFGQAQRATAKVFVQLGGEAVANRLGVQ
jgi:hypothetical protein